MTRRDGGPAFPHTFQTMAAPLNAEPGKLVPAEPVTVVSHGMTVRDYFAAHAPIDLADARNHWHKMHGSGSRQPTMQDIVATVALLRGEYADAMMAERSAT
jgi:broad specificity phosphatase PhoE